MRLLNLSLQHGRLQRMYCGEQSHPGLLKTNQRLPDLSKRTRQFHFTARGQNTNDSAGEEDAARSDASATRESYLEARRKGVLMGRRRLSPLERVGGMIEAKTETGVQDLTRDPRTSGIRDAKVVEKVDADETNSSRLSDYNDAESRETSVDGESSTEGSSFDKTQHRGPPLVDGEYIIITRENLKRQEKLVRLIKLDARLEFKCKFGNLLHADIIGHQGGSVFATDMDIELLIRRPSLDEFVLYMKRNPVIAYPKVIACMRMICVDEY